MIKLRFKDEKNKFHKGAQRTMVFLGKVSAPVAQVTEHTTHMKVKMLLPGLGQKTFQKNTPTTLAMWIESQIMAWMVEATDGRA